MGGSRVEEQLSPIRLPGAAGEPDTQFQGA